MSGKIGKPSMLMYGNNTMLYALGMLLKDLEQGVIDIGVDINSISTERGREFEKDVLAKLKSNSFVASRIKDVPSSVGDIDAVAFNESKGILLVIEAKSPTINLDVGKISKQMNESLKWYKQLNQKVQWVEKNLDSIRDRLKVDKAKTLSIDGIVVVDVPWYHESHPKYKLITSDELDLFLRIRKGDFG